MRRIISFIATVLVATSVFAQNTSYTELLETAKKYEEEKQWIHALGTYYDVMETGISKEAHTIYTGSNYSTEEINKISLSIPTEVFESHDRWEQITKSIMGGNPGIGGFDAFDLVDNWILLMQEYERYWTENAPMAIIFAKPVRTALNRETRTATYLFGAHFKSSDKYDEISRVVINGFKKAYNADWKLDYLKNWPSVSVYSNQRDTSNFMQSGATLVSVNQPYIKDSYGEERKVNWFSKDRKEYSDGSPNLIAKKMFTFKEGLFTKYTPLALASTANVPVWEKDTNGSMHETNNHKMGLYDIKFTVMDENGNILLQSARHMVTNHNSGYVQSDDGSQFGYEFKDVPQNVTKLIDDGKIIIRLSEMHLVYGKISEYVIIDERTWLKSLPEIKIPLENVSSKMWTEETGSGNSSWMKNSVLGTASYFKKVAEQERQAQERKRIAEEERLEKERQEQIALDQKKYEDAFHFLYSKILESYRLFGRNTATIKGDKKHKTMLISCLYPQDSLYFTRDGPLYINLHKNYDVLIEKYTLDKISSVVTYLSCNNMSIHDRLEPCYRLKNGGESDLESFLENFDDIICDITVNGWRVATDDEIKYAQKKIDRNLLPNLMTYGIMKKDSVHVVRYSEK